MEISVVTVHQTKKNKKNHSVGLRYGTANNTMYELRSLCIDHVGTEDYPFEIPPRLTRTTYIPS